MGTICQFKGMMLKLSKNLDDTKLYHFLYLSLSRVFTNFLNELEPDWTIVHYTPGIFGIPKRFKTHLILHGVPTNQDMNNECAVRIADKLSAVSHSVRDGWVRLHDLKDLNIEVIHNGIENGKFIPKANQHKNFDVFFVGRLIEIKGVEYLVQAIKLLSERYPRIQAKIGGTGPEKDKLESLIKSLNLENNVHLIGFVDEDDLVNYYQSAKVAVFPSYDKEGVLTTLLEASSCATPVVTSNCCGMVDFVQDGVTGLLANPKDPQSIADKIDMLLSDSKKAEYIGNHARDVINERWTWEHAAKKLFDYLVN